MKKETKEEVQIYTAVGMLVAGVALSVAGFIVEPTGQIHESVLWFFCSMFDVCRRHIWYRSLCDNQV